MKIMINAIECLSCGDVVVSRSVHHMNSCTCGKVMVDGGQDYLRRGGIQGTHYREACSFDIREGSKPGDLDGKFVIFSPQGTSNPSVAFDRKVDADRTLLAMASRIKDSSWYVAQLVKGG
jgi:hypothetical protein